jgi:hypothetical protein
MSPLSDGLRHSYFYVGLSLLGLFLVQQAGGLRWPWLGQLQTDDLYKQFSGFALLCFIAHQWRFSVLRARGRFQQAAGLMSLHRGIGVAAPILFYCHSEGFGHAYQAALSSVFLAVYITGLFNMDIIGVRKPWARTVWLTAHVGLATLLPFLLGYHVFITYAYE